MEDPTNLPVAVGVVIYFLLGIAFILVCSYDAIIEKFRDRMVSLFKGLSRRKEPEPTLRSRALGKWSHSYP